MVLIESLAASEFTPTQCDIHVEGGMFRAVVPRKYFRCLVKRNSGGGGSGNGDGSSSGQSGDEACCFMEELMSSRDRRKLSAMAAMLDETDHWEGVNDMLVGLDSAIVIDHDADMFKGKRVLELGFVTGLPSAMAIKYDAESVHMHGWDDSDLDAYVKPTLRKNNVSPQLCKFTAGDYADCKASLKLQKYHIVLAPELLANKDEEEFDALHDILDQALTADGLIFVTARPYYDHGSGSLPSFLDFLKKRGRFDAFVRWTAPVPAGAADSGRPRKMLQISRR